MTELTLQERHDYFNLYHGIPSTGYEVACRYVDLGRRTGKTTMMVNSIPDGPCVIVTVSYEWKTWILDYLRKNRPEYDDRNIKVIVAKTIWDVEEQLRGNKDPVFFDNAFFDNLTYQVIGDFYKRNP